WFPYLYGNETHTGVDLPAALGTNVYAVESGTVVDLRETIDNNTGTGFGNFVLIRHAATHYIRQNNGTSVNQMGYIYSIHGHLAKNSVSPVIGDLVNAGQVIAQVDNTGNSTGNHIHLQIDLHQLGDRVLSNLGSEIRSRNPELWLPPYNSTTRATAIGLVTNQTGTPQGGLRICGIQKPAADILNTYVTVHTYNQNDENPDDILVENFGTTDVQPGTYHLYARNQNSPDDCNGTVYKDLGNYTFAAGQTTYIGLYPVYLPDIRANFNGWNSTLVIRNNSSTDTARVVTTFFWSTGSYNVFQQRTDTVAPRATFTFNAPNPAGSYYYGAAMVVASQDVSVVVARYRTSPYASAAYTGITSTGTTVRLPLIQRANWGLYSDLIVMNVGSSSTDATVTFQRLNQSGDICAHTLFSIAPKGSATLNTNNVPCLGTNFVGSARITSSQPLAVISTQWLNDQAASGQLTDYEGFPSSFDPHYLPQLMRNNFNLSNGLALQNPNGSSNAVRIDFYNQTPPLGDCSLTNCPWQYTI
ncbi:MAG: M23 family metallopeptidase, partial [Nitrososphaera sp.]